MATLTDKQIAFLQQPFYAVATTLRADGSPHSTVVWQDVRDGVLFINTAEGRAKPRHLEGDPRISLTVVDPEDGYRWIAVDGDAELTTEGGDADIDWLAKKYMGVDEYPWRVEGQVRVTARITPRHVTAYGLDD
ncbi:MAG: PPOX class F420-dependent oxidoreductase [Actinobacteria bacterium]|nr:PPOX class F420-dependent oxidoreductase [Actinomycetota bacterium]MBV8563771.1 PPOX class F420-dependent oxidoreductase [Actinomycetota bacterium]